PAVLRMKGGVGNDLRAVGDVKPGGRVKVAGLTAAAHLHRGGRLEFRKPGGRLVVDRRLPLLVSGLVGANFHGLSSSARRTFPPRRDRPRTGPTPARVLLPRRWNAGSPGYCRATPRWRPGLLPVPHRRTTPNRPTALPDRECR